MTQGIPDGPVLGISGDYHDAAASIVIAGEIVAAAQEERFSRRKHDPELPLAAIAWCLEDCGVAPGDLTAVAFHGKPMTTYERILRSHARAGPHAFGGLRDALRSWTGRKLWVGYRIERALKHLGHPMPLLTFVEHHVSHAASAFYPSPFESAAVLTFDGVGEWATTTIAHGTGNSLEMCLEVRYPDSLGLLYSAVTALCGFAVNDGESKLMGLAPYGEPTFEDVLRDRVIDLRADGSFRLDPQWFDFESGRSMVHPRLHDLLAGPPREPGASLTQRDADLAASVQVVLDDAILGVARRAHELTGERRACLAGGVALNCVANGRLLERGPFEELWIQPAAGDAGGAPGAALWAAHALAVEPLSRSRRTDGMSGCALGPAFDDDEIAAWLTASGFAYESFAEADLVRTVAQALDQGAIVGWFQGRMEFGPRALGNRSILADPRRAEAVTRINAQVKGREGFRPLAPAVLAERAGDLFDLSGPSPYMLRTAQVRRAVPLDDVGVDEGRASLAEQLASVRSPIPACTHVDGSARVQTVDAERFPRFHALLAAFDEVTGCPVLVNTSFNLADEPIVRSPAEALSTAVRGVLDLLVLGSHVLDRSEMNRVAVGAERPGPEADIR